MAELFETCLNRFSNMENVVLCKSKEDFVSAQERGDCASVLEIEGAEVIDCDPSVLGEVADKGVKVIAPVWNIFNGLCGSSAELSGKGLTSAGVEFCNEAVRLGILLDISHASEAAAFEMLNRYPGRVFASHSNSYSVCSNKNGGTVGINLYTPFLSDLSAGISDAADHICRFASLLPDGVKHISLGFDLDGCDSLPKGFTSSADGALLATELACRGFDRQSIIDIFHDNLFGFIWERQEL